MKEEDIDRLKVTDPSKEGNLTYSQEALKREIRKKEEKHKLFLKDFIKKKNEHFK